MKLTINQLRQLVEAGVNDSGSDPKAALLEKLEAMKAPMTALFDEIDTSGVKQDQTVGNQIDEAMAMVERGMRRLRILMGGGQRPSR